MISVIVPVYNVEEYLEECLESIQHQTYTDIEVILVNDGSRDGSKEICERYCQQDSRFHLINQENKGLSGARNRGMTESKGELITFVDSDDVLKEDMLEQLMKQMTSEDIDIVECWCTYEKHELDLPSPKHTEIIFQGNGQEALVALCKDNILRWNAWAKLCRREVILNFPFLEGLFYEDVYGSLGILKHIRKMVKINYIGYYYRVRPNSIMTKPFNEKDLDIFKVGNQLIDSFKDDENMLPYIGYFMFYLGHGHYLKDGINTKSPYVDLYEDFIQNAAFIAKQSKEVVQKYRLLRLYLFAPKYYTTITYPIYKSLQKRWISTKKVMNNLNDKLHIRRN